MSAEDLPSRSTRYLGGYKRCEGGCGATFPRVEYSSGRGWTEKRFCLGHGGMGKARNPGSGWTDAGRQKGAAKRWAKAREDQVSSADLRQWVYDHGFTGMDMGRALGLAYPRNVYAYFKRPWIQRETAERVMKALLGMPFEPSKAHKRKTGLEEEKRQRLLENARKKDSRHGIE